MSVSFTVYGKPQPQGSSKAFIPKGWKRAVITSDNKNLKGYRQAVTLEAMRVAEEQSVEKIVRPNPVVLSATFVFMRPKSRKVGEPHTVRPDLSKLIRAAEDALTGVLYDDDSQIVAYGHVRKEYGEPERTEITVGPA